MGLLRDAIGSALGADQVKNGFNGPKLPFSSNNKNGNRNCGDTADTPIYSSSYRSNASLIADRRYSQVRGVDKGKRQEQSTYESRPSRSGQKSGEKIPQEFPSSANRDGMTSGIETARSSKSASWADAPPEYEPRQTDSLSSGAGVYQRWHDGVSPYETHHSPYSTISQKYGFRPLALPQTTYGEGQPFLRGYSDELEDYGISQQDFMQALDAINVAIIPNPEVQIFQKAAGIAGWFVPGSASIGLMAGQFGVGIANAFGHASMVARVLSKANLDIFVPNGLEICIGKSKDVDAEVGGSPSSAQQSMSDGATPEVRLASYGDLLAPLSILLPPQERTGRRDPIAMFGQAIGNRDNQRKVKRADKKMAKGKGKKREALEQDLKWLIVRRATPGAVAHWQETLRQSDAALEQEQVEMTSSGR